MLDPSARSSTPRAFTLVELLVAVVIVAILLAILIPSIMAARDSAKSNAAKAQMQMIANAIDEYASFWPPSDMFRKALPPWRPQDLWPISGADPDFIMRIANLANGNVNPELVRANECLAWCLTAKVGKGPCLKKPPGGLVERDPATCYPGTSIPLARLLDPWGTPYLYCCVAENGMWLFKENFILTHPTSDPHPPAVELQRHPAVNFVLVSAGPNKQFDYPVPSNPTYAPERGLGTKVKTWESDDIILGR